MCHQHATIAPHIQIACCESSSSYKPIEPKEGEPRQPNKAHLGLLGAIGAYSALSGKLASLVQALTTCMTSKSGPCGVQASCFDAFEDCCFRPGPRSQLVQIIQMPSTKGPCSLLDISRPGMSSLYLVNALPEDSILTHILVGRCFLLFKTCQTSLLAIPVSHFRQGVHAAICNMPGPYRRSYGSMLDSVQYSHTILQTVYDILFSIHQKIYTIYYINATYLSSVLHDIYYLLHTR